MKKFVRSICSKVQSVFSRANDFVQDVKGDLATNTIGAIIVAVVIIGLLVVAINAFFPSFFTDMFNAMKDKLLVNFDCVSDGDNIMFVQSKKAHKAYAESLEAAFLPRGEKNMMFEKSSRVFYPSDQQHFAYGVGVAALKKAPVIGYYMDRIHTPRDTVFDERNIELLRDGAVRLAEKV